MKLQRIMVAMKPWERGLPIAANHARQLARSADAEIEIVGSVYDAAVSAGRDRGDAAAHRTQDRTVASARAALERMVAPMRHGAARVTTRVVWGVPPYEAILAAAEDWRADLLVVGTHERGTLHTRLTDTDWQLMRRARCPLLLVRGVAFCGYRTILAAADLLHERCESSGIDRAVRIASRCVADTCGATVTEVDLAVWSPAEAIIDAAAHRRADLVVVGASRSRGSAAAVVGNTAELVAGELPCDVLIVPMPAEQPSASGLRSQVG